MTEIPPEIAKQIKATAAEEWPGDREMQQHFFEVECISYRAVADFDFGTAETERQRIIDLADEFCGSWEEREEFYRDQATAYAALQSFDYSGLPDQFVADMLAQADEVSGENFDQKLEFINQSIKKLKEIERIRAEIAPIRDLLIRMESIIGNECYNGNIQNYESYGVWESEGRSFRYPLTFIKDGKALKQYGLSGELADEELLTGQYRFGANELGIFRALVKIVRVLKEEYGLDVPPK